MHCEKEELLNRIQRDLYYDNGKRSFSSRLNTIEDKMEKYDESITNIDLNIERLIQFQTEQQTKDSLMKDKKSDTKWFVGMLITTLASLATMILNVVV